MMVCDNMNNPQNTLPLKLIIILFLIIACYAAFSQVLNHGFIDLDDGIYVTKNPQVQRGLTIKGFCWAFTTNNDAGFWLPLTWISLMADSHLYGLNAGGFHLTNLLLHIFNALLLFLILEWITGGIWQSAFVAALFALHPLKVESVAWISERKDVLSALFFLLTIWAYARYVKHPAWTRYLFICLWFILGLMSKPMLVTLPFVLLLMDFWPFGRLQTGKGPFMKGSQSKSYFTTSSDFKISSEKCNLLGLIFEKIPLFLLAGVFSILAFLTQKSEGALASIHLTPLSYRIANALIAYVKYIGKTIWPHHLGVFYPHQNMPSMGYVIGAFLFLLGVSIIVIWKAQRPYLLVGWFWYIGTLIPVIGLMQVGSQAMADRFTYIPIIGLFIMVVWGVSDLLSQWPYRVLISALLSGSVLFILMICTWTQTGYWKNSITLFKKTLQATDNNWLIQNNLGYALHMNGKVEDAILHFREALRIRPHYAQAHFNLANALIHTGQIEQGITHYQSALKLNPNDDDAYNNLGSALAQQGKIEEAILQYLTALKINPNLARAEFNLGVALMEKGDFKEATIHFKKALNIMPEYAKVHFPLGLAYIKIGDRRSALEVYKALKTINSNLADILFDRIFDRLDGRI
jgi:tetratricopeptide (TPR) repeat protein